MTRTSLMTACAACLLLGIASTTAQGQDEGDPDGFRQRMTEYLESNGLPRYSDLTFSDGVRVAGNVIRADQYTLDRVTRDLTASGNVSIVMTRPDGSTETLQTNQLTVRGYRSEPSAAEVRQAQRPLARARELGVTAFRNGLPIRLIGASGRYVFADDFQLDPGTNDVDAIGNVRVMTYDDGDLVSTIRVDRLTIREGF